MTPEFPMHLLWPFIAVSVVLALLGKGASRLVFMGPSNPKATGWRAWFYLTMPVQPVVVGACLGAFLHMPVPEGLPAALWYAFAGGISPALYSAVNGFVKRKRAKDAEADA